MRLGRASMLRNLAGSVALLSAVGVLAVGLPTLDAAIPSRRAIDDRPFAVGAGVSVVPPKGSQLDLTLTRPGERRGTAVFLIGPIRYVIVVTRFAGDLDEAAARLRRKITGVPGRQITGKEIPTTTASGLEGLQGGYTAPGRGGRYLVFRAGEVAIEVTVAGSDVELAEVLEKIDASTRTITYEVVP